MYVLYVLYEPESSRDTYYFPVNKVQVLYKVNEPVLLGFEREPVNGWSHADNYGYVCIVLYIHT